MTSLRGVRPGHPLFLRCKLRAQGRTPDSREESKTHVQTEAKGRRAGGRDSLRWPGQLPLHRAPPRLCWWAGRSVGPDDCCYVRGTGTQASRRRMSLHLQIVPRPPKQECEMDLHRDSALRRRDDQVPQKASRDGAAHRQPRRGLRAAAPGRLGAAPRAGAAGGGGAGPERLAGSTGRVKWAWCPAHRNDRDSAPPCQTPRAEWECGHPKQGQMRSFPQMCFGARWQMHAPRAGLHVLRKCLAEDGDPHRSSP